MEVLADSEVSVTVLDDCVNRQGYLSRRVVNGNQDEDYSCTGW